jgi:hypothetical protein
MFKLLLLTLFATHAVAATNDNPAINDIVPVFAGTRGVIKLGPNGGSDGDYLDQVVIANPSTQPNNMVSLRVSGGSSQGQVVLLPPGSPIGVYSLKVQSRSRSGGFALVTSGGSSVLAIGRFR